MIEGAVSDLAVFLEYLDRVHARTRRVIMCIPPESFEWAPAPGRFTFGDIVRHLAAIERHMYAETVVGRQSRYVGHGKELADGREATLALYDRLHEESRAIFAALSPEQYRGKVETPAGATISCWKWLRAHVEHEAHHRGQLYLMLGMIGVKAPPIYGLTSEELAARGQPAGWLP